MTKAFRISFLFTGNFSFWWSHAPKYTPILLATPGNKLELYPYLWIIGQAKFQSWKAISLAVYVAVPSFLTSTLLDVWSPSSVCTSPSPKGNTQQPANGPDSGFSTKSRSRSILKTCFQSPALRIADSHVSKSYDMFSRAIVVRWAFTIWRERSAAILG